MSSLIPPHDVISASNAQRARCGRFLGNAQARHVMEWKTIFPSSILPNFFPFHLPFHTKKIFHLPFHVKKFLPHSIPYFHTNEKLIFTWPILSTSNKSTAVLTHLMPILREWFDLSFDPITEPTRAYRSNQRQTLSLLGHVVGQKIG